MFESGLTDVEHETIIDEIFAARSEWRFTHRICGRWENTYIPFLRVKSARKVLTFAEKAGKQITGYRTIIPRVALGMPFDGFWFNIAAPGESTGAHRHSSKATLSGVYYLSVPPRSGNIRFIEGDEAGHEIPVYAGLLVLFSPDLRHAVDRNDSQNERVSLAFNLYRLPLDETMEPQSRPVGIEETVG
jgi:hypothetical protein